MTTGHATPHEQPYTVCAPRPYVKGGVLLVAHRRETIRHSDQQVGRASGTAVNRRHTMYMHHCLTTRKPPPHPASQHSNAYDTTKVPRPRDIHQDRRGVTSSTLPSMCFLLKAASWGLVFGTPCRHICRFPPADRL